MGSGSERPECAGVKGWEKQMVHIVLSVTGRIVVMFNDTEDSVDKQILVVGSIKKLSSSLYRFISL